jgi:hypothetical protein
MKARAFIKGLKPIIPVPVIHMKALLISGRFNAGAGLSKSGKLMPELSDNLLLPERYPAMSFAKLVVRIAE